MEVLEGYGSAPVEINVRLRRTSDLTDDELERLSENVVDHFGFRPNTIREPDTKIESGRVIAVIYGILDDIPYIERYYPSTWEEPSASELFINVDENMLRRGADSFRPAGWDVQSVYCEMDESEFEIK